MLITSAIILNEGQMLVRILEPAFLNLNDRIERVNFYFISQTLSEHTNIEIDSLGVKGGSSVAEYQILR